jgi:glycosyltransferase involved in cell wall biosynthesis
MSPKVTVLMPVYNASLFLEEAIESILNQSFREFEFLIIDDGSTDDSIALIEKFTDERIRLIRNEKNLGISLTLNRGIELATCELIARMDSDDISKPDRLEKQYNYMAAHPECGLLSSWARVITPDKELVILEKHPHYFYYYNLNFECWIYHPTVMYRRQAVVKAGMYSKPYSEDYDLFWKMARETVIYTLEESLVDYRLSPNSLNTVTRKDEYALANRENVLRNIRYYMGEDFDLPEPYLECLRHNFSPILALNSIDSLLECLDLLDKITEAIRAYPNINRNVSGINTAAYFKKDFIVEELFLQLPGLKKFSFVFRARKSEVLFRKVEKSLRWRLNSVKQRLQSTNKR